MSFKFDLRDKVAIALSDTAAEVIGRADYSNNTPNTYFLFYKDSQGNPCKNWWDEGDLVLRKTIN